MYWDASALIPLLVEQPRSEEMLRLPSSERVVWWGTRPECISAMCRLLREGRIDAKQFAALHSTLILLVGQAIEVQPMDQVRRRAERLLRVHPLMAADALQLAAALIFTEEQPQQYGFVCLDERLRFAASQEGFAVQPPSL